MAALGYGNVPDRAFVAFERELEEAAWKDIADMGNNTGTGTDTGTGTGADTGTGTDTRMDTRTDTGSVQL